MSYRAEEFISKILSEQSPTNLSMYKSQKFCDEMKTYALECVTKILFAIITIHSKHNNVRGHESFFLSDHINTTDSNGLNALDYCAIAGLDDIGYFFAGLGGENTLDLNRLIHNVNPSLFGNTSPISLKIYKAIHAIEESQVKYKKNPHNEKVNVGGDANATAWQKLKYKVKNFPYRQHKFPILLLLFGVSCLVAAPFTGGLSVVLLLSLGFPAMLAGVGSLQGAVTALKNYQQAETNARITHEIRLLNAMHVEICHQAEMLPKQNVTQDVHAYVKHKPHQTTDKPEKLLYLSTKVKHGKNDAEQMKLKTLTNQ